jgi:hypothetical protein
LFLLIEVSLNANSFEVFNLKATENQVRTAKIVLYLEKYVLNCEQRLAKN